MSEEEEAAMKADILSTVQGISEKWGVNLADPDFHQSDIGGKMLGAGFVNVMGNYPTADKQKQVLKYGLDWVGKQHNQPPGLLTQLGVGSAVVSGLKKSGILTDDDIRKSWGIQKPIQTLFEYFSSNPEIAISSGLHELDEDKFVPQ